jgi:hypothetical protein
MPADERIKVTFRRLHVRNNSDPFGDGEFFFIASVGGRQVGNPGRIFKAVEGKIITLPEADWSSVVNVLNQNQLVISFQVKEQDPVFDDDLGTVRHTHRRPFVQQSFRSQNRFWLLEWDIELSVEGAFGVHPPAAVFATRTTAGGVTATTVSGNSFLTRGEIHPVRPVPIPPPNTVLPNRPNFPAGTAAEQLNSGGTAVTAADPINVIPNPAVIPILGPAAAAPAGPLTPPQLDAAAFANARNCARIELTYFRPQTLAFADNDNRLDWRVVSVAGGGNADFLGPPKGAKILVFGTAAGEVLLECRFKGALFATYRALVQNVRQIPCRININNGNTTDSIPRATPADAKNHLDIANRFLRQLALELTLDTNLARTNGAQATAIPGIFRIRVTRGQTRNMSAAAAAAAVLRNHRPGVMNFAYVHSDRAGNLGVGMDFPNSGAPGNVVNDAGTPSTSWVRPTGVGIGADAAAGPVAMNVIAGIPRAGHPQLFSMYVTDANGGALAPPGNHATPAQQLTYANTMTHEFGHILNLGHRVEGTNNTHPTPNVDMPAGTPLAQLRANGIFWDGMLHPPHENVMQWQDPPALAQDFDIIQARAVALSPIVTGAVIVPPAVVPPPPPPPPKRNPDVHEYTVVEGDWLEKIAERFGMSWQELYAFDGGTGVANRERLRSGDPNLIYPGEVILVPGPPAAGE